MLTVLNVVLVIVCLLLVLLVLLVLQDHQLKNRQQYLQFLVCRANYLFEMMACRRRLDNWKQTLHRLDRRILLVYLRRHLRHHRQDFRYSYSYSHKHRRSHKHKLPF